MRTTQCLVWGKGRKEVSWARSRYERRKFEDMKDNTSQVVE